VDVTAQRGSRDDGMPSDCARIEVRVGEIRQLFNSMDPARFRERDLDPGEARLFDRLGAMYVQVVHE
jgi:hypothetical protein